MQIIEKSKVAEHLAHFRGRTVYVHMEVTPGGIARNVALTVQETHIAGDGPYRVAIRFEPEGWIRVENLTHYEWDRHSRLLLAGHDDRGRLTTGLELSTYLFTEGEGQPS